MFPAEATESARAMDLEQHGSLEKEEKGQDGGGRNTRGSIRQHQGSVPLQRHTLSDHGQFVSHGKELAFNSSCNKKLIKNLRAKRELIHFMF